MTETPETAKATDAQTLAGGESVTVTDRAGASREIFVRQLRYSELAGYLVAEQQGDLAALAFVTGEDAEALDLLPLTSLEALIAADRRQTFTSARAYEQRQYEKGVRALEGLREQMPERYAKIIGDLEKVVSPSPVSSRVSLSGEPAPGANSPR